MRGAEIGGVVCPRELLLRAVRLLASVIGTEQTQGAGDHLDNVLATSSRATVRFTGQTSLTPLLEAGFPSPTTSMTLTPVGEPLLSYRCRAHHSWLDACFAFVCRTSRAQVVNYGAAARSRAAVRAAEPERLSPAGLRFAATTAVLNLARVRGAKRLVVRLSSLCA